ncbi:MAG: DUF6456 domain-containing protein [Pseudomonadota bacterium]
MGTAASRSASKSRGVSEQRRKSSVGMEGRDILPVLRRLARRGARAQLRRVDPRDAGAWHIVSAPDGGGATAQSGGERDASSLHAKAAETASTGAGGVPVSLMTSALSAGLVERDGDFVKLSSGGAAFLRRNTAAAASATQDPFQAQHQIRRERTLPGVTTETVTVNETESPLGWLRNRKDRRTGQALISASQFTAGERLRQDFLRGQMQARVTADWSSALSGHAPRRTDGEGRLELSDAALSAKQRFYRALDAVGEELSDVLIWVCCDGRGLREVEMSAGWPQRSGKVMLQTALQALARHYGLAPSRRAGGSDGPKRRGAIRHWGANDYKPALDRSDDA